MNLIVDYVTQIANVLIFIAFITILLPSDKYTKYINLTMGIFIIIAIIGPIKNILNKNVASMDLMFSASETYFGKEILKKEKSYYEEEQLNLIMDTYKDNLNLQLENFISGQGYNIVDSEIDINLEDNHFGEINKIYLELSKKDTGKKKDIIQIEKINISPQISTNGDLVKNFQGEKDTEEIKNVKNLISNFYNLSFDNIHIIIA